MKRTPFLVGLALGLASCSSPSQVVGSTIDPAVVYDVNLDVRYNEYSRVPGHGGLRSEYTMTYSMATSIRPGEAIQVEPLDGKLDWMYHCFSSGFGPTVEDLGVGYSESVGVVPGTREQLPTHIDERFRTDLWVDGPVVSLEPGDAGLTLAHRLPGSVASGQDIECPGSDEPLRVFLPTAGAGWMMAKDGESPSRAEQRNDAAGTEVYAAQSDAGSGWLLVAIPDDRDSVPIDFTIEEADEMGGWTLTVVGEVRR